MSAIHMKNDDVRQQDEREPTDNVLKIIIEEINGSVYGVIRPYIIYQTQIDDAFAQQFRIKEKKKLEVFVSYAKFCHVFYANLENAETSTATATQCEKYCECVHMENGSHVSRTHMMNAMFDVRTTGETVNGPAMTNPHSHFQRLKIASPVKGNVILCKDYSVLIYQIHYLPI